MFDLLRNIGSGEVLVIVAFVLLFFGGKKFSEFAQGLKESKKELGKIKEDLQNPDDNENKTAGGDEK